MIKDIILIVAIIILPIISIEKIDIIKGDMRLNGSIFRWNG